MIRSFSSILLRQKCFKARRIQVHYFRRYLLFFPSVKRILPASKPGGNIIESVNVQKLGPSVWSVSLVPASCGTGIGLLQVAEANVVSGNTSSDQAIFQPINGTANSNILVSRDQASTPPIGGTFDLLLENEEVKGNLEFVTD